MSKRPKRIAPIIEPLPIAQSPTEVSHAARVLLLTLSLMPLGLLVYKMAACGMNFPYWDEMLLLPLIDKAHTGALGFIDFWAQHNEHRPFFPRLIIVGLALATHWNVWWVLAANVLCGIGVFLILASALLRTPGNGWSPLWAMPVLSFFVFSWSQMENWVWGLELTVFLCVLATVAGIVAASGRAPGWGRFFAAIGFGIVASYSFANGLVYWFAALPVILLTPDLKRDTRILRATIWGVAAFLVIESYMFDYHKPGVSPPLSAVLAQPQAYLGYVLLYLGSPVTGFFFKPPWHGGPAYEVGPLHFLPGIAGIGLCAWLLWRIHQTKRVAWSDAAPWLSLMAFAVGSALATGIGRVGLGIFAGLYSRYMTTNMLFWCGLIGLGALWVRSAPEAPSADLSQLRLCVRLATALIALQLLVLSVNQPWEENVRWKKMGWQAIRMGIEQKLFLEDISWNPPRLKEEFLPLLRQYKLCGFGDPEPDRAQLAQQYLEEARLLTQRELWYPALTYLNTVETLDPSIAETKTLRDKAPAAVRERFQAYEQAPLEKLDKAP
jgi:hypothetical protein